jgi:hypothetical protein
MDNHAEGQEFGKSRAISKLDWPTHEMLAAAHRARGLFLRELVVSLFRWLNTPFAEHQQVARPAEVRIARKR